MNQLIVVHCLRPDRLMACAHRLVSAAFGEGFMQQDKVIDLHDIIDNEVRPSLKISRIERFWKIYRII